MSKFNVDWDKLEYKLNAIMSRTTQILEEVVEKKPANKELELTYHTGYESSQEKIKEKLKPLVEWKLIDEKIWGADDMFRLVEARILTLKNFGIEVGHE